jgi:hypothetical protein
VARNANGATISPEMRTIAGYAGLWFDQSLEVSLGVAVESISLSVAGSDVKVSVVARGGAGEQVTNSINVVAGEASVILKGKALTSLTLGDGLGRTVLTRLCVDRPGALPGIEPGNANVITVKG